MLGNIKTPALHIAEGVIYKGNVNITAGAKQDAQKIVGEYFESKQNHK